MEQAEQIEHIDNELIDTDKILSELNKFIVMPSLNSYTIVYENPAFVPLFEEWNKNNHKQKRLF